MPGIEPGAAVSVSKYENHPAMQPPNGRMFEKERFGRRKSEKTRQERERERTKSFRKIGLTG